MGDRGGGGKMNCWTRAKNVPVGSHSQLPTDGHLRTKNRG